ncbi:MAG: cobalamin biosynthesis protein CobD [Lentisphaerae bacterium]|nr:cobalamin biosynthesis protein CobD [Lentisphaerota bacterium]MBT5609700.1 cobalamin biosynthesis protein CobD [Lentisphaerota bacterium]MBT7061436.1 cobalamin biosynthesis protein CobD [Lentisphaerota bacterium]MBT7844184.1 cobalamin biosynthesis protein CobD [Lentisphaerota bacterium]
MRLEYQLIAALALDLLIGDPPWLPHPVRWMGNGALWLEPRMRRFVRNERVAGVCTGILVVALSGAATSLLVVGCMRIHPIPGSVVSVWLLYTTIAARDLARHAERVRSALAADGLGAARKQVGMIVGRDTAELDEQGVVRAAVESVAESTVDGATAPILFAVLFGPIGAIMYRAVNTLDSTFGYKNERYAQFGWFSARLDDLANLVPARLTAFVAVPVAGLLGHSPMRTARVTLRDARNHASPNSGFMEAAVAGALGVQLGGKNSYFGVEVAKPTIGDADVRLQTRHIRQATRLMYLTTASFAALMLLARWAITHGGL